MARIKAYFRLDLYFFENPKTVDLSHAATVLYIAAIAHANRRETDGFVHRKVLRRLIDLDPTLEYEPTHGELAEELVKAGLWEPAEEGWQIHDFLEHNESSAEREDRREAERDRKRRERSKAKQDGPDRPDPPSGGPSGPVRSDNSGRPEASAQTKTPGAYIDVDVALPEQSRAEGQINTVVEQARPDDPIAVVFDAWQDATGKHRARLDDKRRRKIKAALRSYSLADVLDAVRGWQHSPHHRGENDTGTVYNELDLLLRDAAHIEQFRDLWRHGPPAQIGRRGRQLLTTAQQMSRWAEQMEGGEDAASGMDRRSGQAQRELPGPAG